MGHGGVDRREKKLWAAEVGPFRDFGPIFHGEMGLEIGQNHETAQLRRPITFFGGHLPPHDPYMSEKPFSEALRIYLGWGG